jgi:multiple sugar transport system permease protein
MARNHGRLSDGQVGFLLVIPGLAVFCAIILYPFISAVLLSFTDRSLLFPGSNWVGLENYRKLFHNVYFFKTMLTTLWFVAGATLLPFVLGFIWAIVLHEQFFASQALRGITLVDWIIPGTAIGFLWSWIFNGEYGILNGLLLKTGLIQKGVPWLGQTTTALLCVIISRAWQMLPWYMAFLLGGLQGVSHEQVESGED